MQNQTDLSETHSPSCAKCNRYSTEIVKLETFGRNAEIKYASKTLRPHLMEPFNSNLLTVRDSDRDDYMHRSTLSISSRYNPPIDNDFNFDEPKVITKMIRKE